MKVIIYPAFVGIKNKLRVFMDPNCPGTCYSKDHHGVTKQVCDKFIFEREQTKCERDNNNC